MADQPYLIAMSGGVDSSVAAWLCQSQGKTCIGAYLQLCRGLIPEASDGAQGARQVAQQLGMQLVQLEASPVFRSCVAEPFVRDYEDGLTPNPCIRCNQTVKFGYLLDRALELGCSHVVTGHYARIRKDDSTGRYLLYKAQDTAKDQSYFLAGLTQHQLSHSLFPLGELTKEQVRLLAAESGLVTAQKKDSQDICFIPDGDYKAFMERFRGRRYPGGDYLDQSGAVVGRHCGAVGYTLGQRKGLGIALGQPVYVCGKDMAANTVTVGPEQALMRRVVYADGWNWLPFERLTQPIQCLARVRYRHAEQPALVTPLPDGWARVEFTQPQRAVTPGQAVVLYRDTMVIGAGTIRYTE